METAVFSLLALLFLFPSANSAPFPKSRKLYEIACTMCSTCCNPVPPSPPPPPPPSPSPPPPSSVAYCPPPPAKSYYSPPPPSTYTYSSPPPPQGGSGGGGCFSGSCFNYPPPDFSNYPAPPPPNPIVPYFPFYFYNPPPASVSGAFKLAGNIGLRLGLPVVGVLLIFM